MRSELSIKFFKYLVCLFVLFQMIGCMSKFSANSFKANIKLEKGDIIGASKILDKENIQCAKRLVDIAPILRTFYFTRNYGKFLKCYKEYKFPQFKGMYAHILLELDKTNEAKNAALEMLAYDKSYYRDYEDKILANMVLGIIQSKSNQIKAAQSTINDIKNICKRHLLLKYCRDDDIVAKNRNYAIALIYFSHGDYKNALNVMGDYDGKQPLERLLLGAFSFGLMEAQYLSGSDKAQNSLIYVAPKMYILAKSNFELGNLEIASKIYKKIIATKGISSFKEIYYLSLFDLAKISQDSNAVASNNFLLKSIDEIESTRSTISSEFERIGFSSSKEQVYTYAVNKYHSNNNFEKAFEYSERAKSRALVDMLANKQNFTSKVKALEANKLITRLDEIEMNSFSLASNENNTHSTLVSTKRRLIQGDLKLASLVSVRPSSLKNIQSKLKQSEVLVEYYGDNKNHFIFILTKNSIKSVKIDSSNLENLVTNYRAALSTRDSKKYKTASKALYNAVIKPVKHLIKGKKLTVVPHGSLHYVPFASLWDGKRYLVQNYQIRTLPSASVMEFLQHEAASKAGNLLILGNPDLGDSDYDLPGAQDEALRLAKANRGSKILLRKNATETALKKYGSSFKNIHFAMHGIFEADKPLTSGLLLAPDSENDGRLTVSELYDLDLNTDLVTLSACETALGETKSGDDVIGFTRGFLYAGASSIVSSLWEVDDEATRDLMLRFYRELKSNNKARALQKAQLRVMKKYPHPYYWAAFQLTGQY
jgi:CHAT domain-containing protein